MDLSAIKNSGLLELYVLGILEEKNLKVVQQALNLYPSLEEELNDIEQSLMNYAVADGIEVPPAFEPLLFATIDYTKRLENGEIPDSPPLLNDQSVLEDYSKWLNRPDMIPPEGYGAMYAKFIAHEAEKLTAIVWLRYGAPDEVHTHEYEKFLIAEGTCEITIGEDVHQLGKGDYLSIPLHINHRVHVTSTVPCKIILQRIAA